MERGYELRILLTGANGQLGYDLRRACGGRHEIIAHDIDLDITERNSVLNRAREINPDMVINAAAYTDVDGAEENETLAYRINALGPYNLALACAELGIPLLQVSTDFVFSGETSIPYTEFDHPCPKGVYAKSKYAGEIYVSMLLNRYYIVRTSWLFGVAGKNFVKTMLSLGRERGEVSVVNDQEGSPTYSLDLAYKIFEIIDCGTYGIYHVSNSGSCTWFQFAREIFEVARIRAMVKPITTEELGRPAPRPPYSVMRSIALEMQGIKPLRDYRDALRDFILNDLPSYEGSS